MMIIWMDGCFDMMHFGHANVFRQANDLGNKMIVGVHSNKEIEKHKGICVMDEEERYFMVESCRWVDKIRRDVPYVPNIQYVIEQGCNLIVHGDDLAISESGDDCYTEARKLNMYKEVSRTKFVSTTDMVGRMLLQRNINIDKAEYKEKTILSLESEYSQDKQQYLDELLVKFKLPEINKESGQKAVYIDGTFDLFHPGHASLLKKCKDNGWYVIAGVFSSDSSRNLKGKFPIQSMKERILTISACKYVDKIIADVPIKPDIKFIRQNEIDMIVTGLDDQFISNYDEISSLLEVKAIESEFPKITTSSIIQKIIGNYTSYSDRNQKRTLRGC